MHKAIKIGWMLLAAQAVAVSMLFGAFYGLKTNIVELKTQARRLEQRVAASEQKLAMRAEAAVPPAAELSSATQLAQPVGDSSAPPHVSDEVARTTDGMPTSPTEKGSPDSVVCVDKMTHAVFACENAANCLGPKSFDATYFNNMRTKLRITNNMMICSAKSTEAAASQEPERRN